MGSVMILSVKQRERENSVQTSFTSMKPASANLLCFCAMIMWAVGFPAAEILLESWGAISLLFIRILLSVIMLMVVWILSDGWQRVINSPWLGGMKVGAVGFGFGAILLLVGQKMSDPVTPAIAAAMMPIFGLAIEVMFDQRKLTPTLILGILFALMGGYLATGVKLSQGSFGTGAFLCVFAVSLFAWTTRATTRNFPTLSSIGQTTITLIGALVFMPVAYVLALLTGYDEIQVGIFDARHLMLLLIFSLLSLGVAQLLWIWGAGQLGILLASFHMNAVPFYVMVTLVIIMGQPWQWRQAAGAGLVAIGVLLAQSSNFKKSKYVAAN